MTTGTRKSPSPPKVAVLDYGMGNLRSVAKALAHVGAEPRVTSDPRDLGRCGGAVLPGVGAFPAAVRELRTRKLLAPLLDAARQGLPMLGICLGMQLLFERSEEQGGADGLGLIEGEVTALASRGLKVPHIGWNFVERRRDSWLLAGLGERTAFYHVHSFAARPRHDQDVVGVARYGEEFVSAVERGTLAGVQFHPEKSGPAGLRVLENFVALCARRTPSGDRQPLVARHGQ